MPNCCDEVGEVLITQEEIEALNLKNIENLDQVLAAERMGTSQSTFQRILSSAYAKTSDALVNGKIIRIDTAEKDKIEVN